MELYLCPLISNALAFVLASGPEMRISLSSPAQESHLNYLFGHLMDYSCKIPTCKYTEPQRVEGESRFIVWGLAEGMPLAKTEDREGGAGSYGRGDEIDQV